MIRLRVLALTVLPIIQPTNGIGTAMIIVLFLIGLSWLDARVHPYVYLRNNNIAVGCNYFLIALLFSGIAYTANPVAATETAISVVLVTLVSLCCVMLAHSVMFEMIYFSNERMSKYRPLKWLLGTRFFKLVFQTQRSYLRDFVAGLATGGNVTVIAMPCLSYQSADIS